MSNYQSWDSEHVYVLSPSHKTNTDAGSKDQIPGDDSIATFLRATDPVSMATTFAAIATYASESETSTPLQYASDAWNFDPARDGFNHSLSNSQCEEAFPEYYKEIDRAAAFWKDEKISQAEMNITGRTGVVRAMIYDRQLYIIESHMDNSPGVYDLYRAMAILGSLNRVIVADQGPIPNIEFVFSVSDVEWNPAPAWTLCRAPDDETHWVMPDFGYWAWDNTVVGSYDQLLRELEDKPTKFSQKKELALWRGADSNEERHNLLQAAEGQRWADIEAVSWGSPEGFVQVVDHCDYQYLIQTEGNSYSGRLKYILNCASVVLMRRPSWIESFTHLLKPNGPDQNIVELDSFVNLPETMDYHLSQQQQSERIAKNAREVFKDRYLTPAAQACYWRQMFEKWASVQSWDPEPWTIEQRSSGEGWHKQDWEEKVWHGVTYELFMLTAWRQNGQV
ncbi:MAG: hypothetical protein M1821_007775 [Bathelium mastoideum]|nr:MAG: hypothetical protein M1821_007775 [Bathelium mastoideum]